MRNSVANTIPHSRQQNFFLCTWIDSFHKCKIPVIVHSCWYSIIKVNFDSKALTGFDSRGMSILVQDCNDSVLMAKSEVYPSWWKIMQWKQMALFLQEYLIYILGWLYIFMRLLFWCSGTQSFLNGSYYCIYQFHISLWSSTLFTFNVFVNLVNGEFVCWLFRL